MLGAAAAITLALAGPALAQASDGSWFPFKLPGLTTGSVTPAAPLPPAPAVPGGPPQWSGESGASGHPLMTAEAIRAAAANFASLPRGAVARGGAARGHAGGVSSAQTAGLTPDLRIMDLMDAQPEFTKAIWDYLDLLVSEDRVRNGRAILATHRAQFDAVEKAYGVDRNIITAIWGVESNYGTQGRPRVLHSTATLACVGRRQDYFREEFLSALEILSRGDVTPRICRAPGPAPSGRPSSCPPLQEIRGRFRRRRPPRRGRFDPAT